MSKRSGLLIAASLVVALVAGAQSLPADGPAAAADAADTQFQVDLAELTKNSHRLAGYENGSLAAAAYVEKRLKEIGFAAEATDPAFGQFALYEQSFPVVQHVLSECELSDGEATYTQKDGFYSCRPNLLLGAITPAEGITAKTMYVGRGTMPEYGSRIPQDRIVVMDLDSRTNWLKSFALGARAVVFIGSEKPAPNPYQHINMPANLPRFYVTPELAETLGLRSESRELTIKAAVEWKQLRGRNLIAVVKGTDITTETLVLAAPLDSFGEVPELSPGARDAANIAGLLKMAEALRNNPPKRTTVLCFFDGQTLNHMGARQFYATAYREYGDPEMSLAERRESLETEKRFVKTVRLILSQPDMFNIDMGTLSPDQADRVEEYKNEAKRIFKQEAKLRSGRILDKLTPIRNRIHTLDKEISELERTGLAEGYTEEQIEQRVQAMTEKQNMLRVEESRLHATDLAWNTLERVIHKELDVYKRETVEELFAHIDPERKIWIRNAEGKAVQRTTFAADPEAGTPQESFRERLMRITPNRFDELIEATVQLMDRRMTELDVLLDEVSQGEALAKRIGKPANSTRAILHLSMSLGDARKRWTFMHGDDSAPLNRDRIGEYGQTTLPAMENIHKTMEAAGELRHFDGRPISQNYADPRIFSPGMLVTSGAAARLFGVPNMSVVTVLDPRPRQGQPTDTTEALDSATLLAQVDEFIAFFHRLAAAPSLDAKLKTDARFADTSFDGITPTGPSVRRAGGGSAMPDFPVRHAVVSLLPSPTGGMFDAGELSLVPPGFCWPIRVMTDVNGAFGLPVVSKTTYDSPLALAAKFDGTRGLITFVTDQASLQVEDLNRAAIILTECQLKTLVGYGFDRGGIETIAMHANSTSPIRANHHLLCEYENIVTIFGPIATEGFKLFNKAGLVMLDNTNSPEGYRGEGISFEDPFEHPFTPLITEHDLRVLNQYRLRVLRERRINQASLEVLMGKSEDLADDALNAAGINREDREAIKTATNRVTIETIDLPAQLERDMSTDQFCGSLAASTDYSRDVYIPLVGVMNDLVTAVVLLLLLSMPFAFALERLLIGTPHIYRQIGWFTFFFLLTFAILFLVNPAFKIATTPIIIFLAFAIILLSCLVIFIMVRKLQTELKKMQGLATTVHSADVSRLSTMLAAVNMGISTMRRRPLRTLLTAITVVLLTFTILTFASFGSQWGNRKTAESPMSGATPRVLVRHQLWNPIGEGVNDMVRGYLAGQADVVPRYWVAPTADDTSQAQRSAGFGFAIADTDGEVVVDASAAIGLDIRDISARKDGTTRQRELASLFHGDTNLLKTNGVFLNETLNARFGLTSHDVGKRRLLVAGHEMIYAGTISPQLSSYAMLEGSSMVPVDYQASGGEQGAFQQEGEPQLLGETPSVASATFINYNYDRVVVLGPAVAQDMGGEIRSLTVYPHDSSAIEDLSESISTVTRLPTYVGHRGGVERLIFTSLTRASGWRDLLVPVLLGGLIIFATLLGSVSDREREIYTFSSLGLAPPHVASLFFAEASIYAVVGGMGGYLLGQVVAVLLGWMSSMGWLSVPTMNYSSTNAIVTIVIVMGTVLVSTIYPAVKASRSANPGIQRRWRIPKPKDDLYDLVFPFTVSTYDITGVVSFLEEHFENFSDTSIGCFATTNCHIFRQEETDMLGFQADVALAPFDLGVNQRFALLSQPSDIEGIDEVRIMIVRTSGTSGDWQRSNRLFINDLRKQLLIWRSLPTEVMEKYRERTLEMWDELPCKSIEPEAFAAEAKGTGGLTASDGKEAQA
ncbi:MAG: hypothetical protein GVY16_07635 [Planctomycetes bacterium]|nr:hypothetical protein [Planctomycetota bacterium]